MTYNAELKVDEIDNDYVDMACENSEIMDEDDALTWTVYFANGFFMDIMCCGCQDDPAYTQCILYNDQGSQVCWSDGDGLGVSGEWEVEADGDIYHVDVAVKEEYGEDEEEQTLAECKQNFMEYMEETFDGFAGCEGGFLRETVENLIDYAYGYYGHSKNMAIEFIADILPNEVEYEEIKRFLPEFMPD